MTDDLRTGPRGAEVDAAVLDNIADLLSGREWEVEDLEIIADLVQRSGRAVEEPAP